MSATDCKNEWQPISGNVHVKINSESKRCNTVNFFPRWNYSLNWSRNLIWRSNSAPSFSMKVYLKKPYFLCSLECKETEKDSYILFSLFLLKFLKKAHFDMSFFTSFNERIQKKFMIIDWLFIYFYNNDIINIFTDCNAIISSDWIYRNYLPISLISIRIESAISGSPNRH